ncbi:Tellurite resistance protein [Bosea sp. 62]|jgi:tellurite resistance-related uncharacterized protein|uniref:DUF1971 domain-containing protein n=1 Tax=Bosea sp. 127 TaxID=2653180 RepID=UPI0012567ADC|nr:DUF1971 domain-containing protein [Bosea sp. 127]CAD5294430.1 Tellurite resistance protein [Bosea sp. 21B]CAD5294973.1 Tellurite resistance protein [Bosea sp. 46]CAD5298728.1 Tellurite resistance protein [Bosea sp. 7B]VVT60878.1 conserved hypothetical protein [Bosea sp. EC-HK365B]VXB56040.1 Tellurite resistance protein [Bosea sp. 125]VXC75519.1 Tellurite resistance protein [Bosea sp. 29B]VXC90988.1 Tellurite resistance protein [Bosea sp. 62]
MPRQPWPEGLTPYRRTPDFTEATIPPGLLKAHATKHSVWAKLHVLAGTLKFRDLASGEQWALSAGVHPLIFPEMLHEVEPCGSVRFFVEFHKPS